MINTQSFKLDIKKATIPRLRVVNGDTANVFVITIQDDGNAVALDATLHKVIAVFTRADGQVYTQDANTGLSFTTGGVVTIEVRPASFCTGTNRVCLQVYKRANSSATVYPLLCTTSEAQFPARASAIPDSGAQNAPSQLPMLEGLIEDAQEAISDCEDATDAANDAADAANDAADAANGAAEAALAAAKRNFYDVPINSYMWIGSALDDSLTTTTTTKDDDETLTAIAADALFAVQVKLPSNDTVALYELHRKNGTVNLMSDIIRAASSDTYTGKRIIASFTYAESGNPHITFNVITAIDDAPTAGSNNPVKSGGIKTAIDEATARVGVRYITPTTLTWNFAHTVATGTLGVTRSEIDALLDAGALVAIYSDTSDSAVVLYPVQSDDMLYFSSLIDSGGYYEAEIHDNTITIQFRRIAEILADELPLLLHITGTEEVTGLSGQTYRKVTFASGETDKIFQLRNTRDMIVRLPVWGANDVVETLRMHEVIESGTLTVVRFQTGLHPLKPADSVQDITVGNIEAYEVAVYYNNGVFDSAVATHFTGTL